MTRLASNLAMSTVLCLAIFLILMVSSGYAMQCMSVDSTPVTATLCVISGSFLICGMRYWGCLCRYLLIMNDFSIILT